MESAKFEKIEDVTSFLTANELPHKLYAHTESKTMEAVMENVKLDHSPFIKNLLYKDKKKRCYLVLAKHDTRVEKGFWPAVGQSPGNVRLAKPQLIIDRLGCEVGFVNPFALYNDPEHKVKLLIDQTLEGEEYWAFHPMSCEAMVEITQVDFKKFLTLVGVEAVFYDLTKEVIKRPKKEGEAGGKQQKKKK